MDVIKPGVETFLDGIFDSFYLTLLVLCIHVDNFSEDIPYVVVGAEHGSGNFPPLDQFPSELRSQGFGVVFSRCATEFLSGRAEAYPWNRQLHKSLRSGVGIGYGLKDTATVGIFIANECGGYIFLTAGHLIDGESCEITQPGLQEFKTRLSQLENTALQLERLLSENPPARYRDQYIIQQVKVQEDLQRLQSFKKDSDNETLKAIKARTVSKHEFKPINYDSRKCVSDWCLFEVENSRMPGASMWEGNPPDDGQLSKVNWNPVDKWGKLAYDMKVRKSGKSSGETYGFVAGVHSAWKPRQFKITCSEYFVLEEKRIEYQQFSRKGDSGAATIDNHGNIVGMVMALVEVEQIEMVIHPVTNVPDILNIARCCQTDGSIDKEKLWYESFLRCRMVLIECAGLIRKRSGIEALADIVHDC